MRPEPAWYTKESSPNIEAGSPRIALYECNGRVHSPRSFALSHLCLLSATEADVLRDGVEALRDRTSDFSCCLTRSSEFAATPQPRGEAARSGARSAYWEERQIKLKGCRPVEPGIFFPVDKIPFGDQVIVREQTPFGVLQLDGVIRELLAYCFFLRLGLPVLNEPLCVFEYQSLGNTIGYCLVFESPGNERVESLVCYPDVTIAELLATRENKKANGVSLTLGSELGLRGLNIWLYVEEKAKQLCAMHLAGGFRGVLNSNIGNDIWLRRPSGKPSLYLCDFDSFELYPIAARPDRNNLDAVVLRFIVEVAMGSLPILEFVDISEDCTTEERADRLGRVFFEKSTLWRAYQRQLFSSAGELGWSLDTLEDSIERMRKTPAFADVLSTCIPNTYFLREMSAERSLFYPHN